MANRKKSPISLSGVILPRQKKHRQRQHPNFKGCLVRV